MKTLIRKLLLILLPVGLLVISFNYFIDPANIFAPPTYIGGIAEIICSGHNVDNLSNYNERLLQEQVLKRTKGAADVMVLGSSRIMEIGSDFFPGRRVLNCGVSHGNINDLVAIIGLADSLDKLPKEVVIGIDHFLIGEGGSQEWMSLFAYEQHFLVKNGGIGSGGQSLRAFDSQKKLSSLFSLQYFKSSLQYFVKRSSKIYYDVSLNTPQLYGRFSDGTVSYSEAYKNPDVIKEAVDARAIGLRSGIPGPDTARIRLFNELLDFLQEKKINVKFVMIPYHPEFYKAVKERQGQLLQTYDVFFRELAERRHIPLTGGFDADGLGMSREYFYDEYHCSKEAIKKYVKVQ